MTWRSGEEPNLSAYLSPTDESTMSRLSRIQASLTNGLTPMHLEVTDESHMHNVPEGAESHFKVLAVSETFTGQKLIERHRRVNALVRDELAGGLHALAIHAWTPQEWFEKGGGEAPMSPECLGGSKQAD
jgi:BolA protein